MHAVKISIHMCVLTSASSPSCNTNSNITVIINLVILSRQDSQICTLRLSSIAMKTMKVAIDVTVNASAAPVSCTLNSPSGIIRTIGLSWMTLPVPGVLVDLNSFPWFWRASASRVTRDACKPLLFWLGRHHLVIFFSVLRQ